MSHTRLKESIKTKNKINERAVERCKVFDDQQLEKELKKQE